MNVSEQIETNERDPMLTAPMLTTVDNPFNPFSQFADWFAFDSIKNYHSCSYLARVMKSSDELTDAEQAYEQEQAIDSIVKLNVNGLYRKVYEDDFAHNTTNQTLADSEDTPIVDVNNPQELKEE